MNSLAYFIDLLCQNPNYLEQGYRLLSELTSVPYSFISQSRDLVLNDHLYKEINYKMQELLNDKPLAYILEYSYFGNLKFKVNKHVLIPRDDSYHLVEAIVKYQNFNHPRILDLCTGSGIIALSLKNLIQDSIVDGSDISIDALSVAQENAKNLNLTVNFQQSDLLAYYTENNYQFDIVVANPPYITNSYPLDASVINYEPHIALFGGDDGLDFYRRIFKDISLVLKAEFLIGLEIGYDQALAVSQIAKFYLSDIEIKIIQDYNHLDRVILIRRGNEKIFN